MHASDQIKSIEKLIFTNWQAVNESIERDKEKEYYTCCTLLQEKKKVLAIKKHQRKALNIKSHLSLRHTPFFVNQSMTVIKKWKK
jgi:hypothetical protein